MDAKPKRPRLMVHYGASITDCGREIMSFTASERFTYDDAAVTCGECRDARAHAKAKQATPRARS